MDIYWQTKCITMAFLARSHSPKQVLPSWPFAPVTQTKASLMTHTTLHLSQPSASRGGRASRAFAVWGVGLALCLGLVLWSRDSTGRNMDASLSAIRHELTRIMEVRHADLQALIVAMDEQVATLGELPDDVSLVRLVSSDGAPRVESVAEIRLDLVTSREKARVAMLQCETVPEIFDGIAGERKLNAQQKLDRLRQVAGLPPSVLAALLRLSEEGVPR